MATASFQLPPPSALSPVSSMLAKTVPHPEGTSVAGQTAIITGANAGLGFEAAKQFLGLGLSRLILGVRNKDKGETAAAELRKLHPSATIEVWLLDMLSYESVQEFAAQCARLDRLDLVILNAGAMAEKPIPGPEGHEKAFQVNYLSTVLLAHLLLPTLKAKSPAGKPGRLTLVNSASAYMAKFPKRDVKPFLPTFDDPRGWDPVEAYTASKALAHLWIVKLAEKVRKEDVVVNIVDPGFCKGTGLHRDLTGANKVVFAVLKPLTGRSMAAGASTYIHASVVSGAESHGSFLMDWKIGS